MVEDTVQVLINHIYDLMADKEKLQAEIRTLKVDASIATEQAEKAKKWDKFVLNKDDLRYWDTAWFRELEDKAKKWDDFISGSGKLYKEINDKAELWDHYELWKTKLYEYKEKAEKLDNIKQFQGSQEAVRQELEKAGLNSIASYVEKARKWDSINWTEGYTIDDLNKTNNIKAEKLQKIRQILDS